MTKEPEKLLDPYPKDLEPISYGQGLPGSDPFLDHDHDGINSKLVRYSGVAGDNQQVQYNDNGKLAGDPDFRWNNVDKALELGTTPDDTPSGEVFIRTTNYVDLNLEVGPGASLALIAGDAFEEGSGGAIQIQTGASFGTDWDASNLEIILGPPTGTGANGKITIHQSREDGNQAHADLTFDELTPNEIREYTFQDISHSIPAPLGTGSTDTTVANSSGGTLAQTSTLNPSLWKVGRVFKFTAWGYYSTKSSGSNRLDLRLLAQSTIIARTEAQLVTNSLSDCIWRVEGMFTCRSLGISGTVFGNGLAEIMTAAQGTPEFWKMGSTSAVTFNTTNTFSLSLAVVWDVTDPSNSITCNQFLIESLN